MRATYDERCIVCNDFLVAGPHTFCEQVSDGLVHLVCCLKAGKTKCDVCSVFPGNIDINEPSVASGTTEHTH